MVFTNFEFRPPNVSNYAEWCWNFTILITLRINLKLIDCRVLCSSNQTIQKFGYSSRFHESFYEAKHKWDLSSGRQRMTYIIVRILHVRLVKIILIVPSNWKNLLMWIDEKNCLRIKLKSHVHRTKPKIKMSNQNSRRVFICRWFNRNNVEKVCSHKMHALWFESHSTPINRNESLLFFHVYAVQVATAALLICHCHNTIDQLCSNPLIVFSWAFAWNRIVVIAVFMGA